MLLLLRLVPSTYGVAPRGRISDYFTVATLTIHLEDDLAREVEECAWREHKSISEWVKERVKPGADRASALAAMEATAQANGYPAGWLALFGSLADDDTFAPPLRSPPRPIEKPDGE
jgi:hypothetical protein